MVKLLLQGSADSRLSESFYLDRLKKPAKKIDSGLLIIHFQPFWTVFGAGWKVDQLHLLYTVFSPQNTKNFPRLHVKFLFKKRLVSLCRRHSNPPLQRHFIFRVKWAACPPAPRQKIVSTSSKLSPTRLSSANISHFRNRQLILGKSRYITRTCKHQWESPPTKMTNLSRPLIFVLVNLAHLHFQYHRVLASFFCEYRSTFPLSIFGPFCFRLELKGKVQIHRFWTSSSTLFSYLIRGQTKVASSEVANLYKSFTPKLALHSVFDTKSVILFQTEDPTATRHRWLSWLNIGLLCERSRVRLRPNSGFQNNWGKVLKITEEKVMPL